MNLNRLGIPDASVSSHHKNESILNLLSQLILQLVLGDGNGILKQFQAVIWGDVSGSAFSDPE